MATKKCYINECDNIIASTSELLLCATCRGSLHRWIRRPASDLLQRNRNLMKYRARIALALPTGSTSTEKSTGAKLSTKRALKEKS